MPTGRDRADGQYDARSDRITHTTIADYDRQTCHTNAENPAKPMGLVMVSCEVNKNNDFLSI